jgi:LPPG:FO 2-phospho-L-lactate transferase
LAAGESLSAATAGICRALGIHARLLPMSDDPISTRLLTSDGWLEFQEYFVHRQCRPVVQEIVFQGARAARAQPDALVALHDPKLRAVIVCPSNPFVSVEPILSVPGIREALQRCRAPVIAVTPIIGGKAVKGPAAKMMQELGYAVSGATIASRYSTFINALVTDESDPMPAPIPDVTLMRAQTLMRTDEDRVQLARTVLALADRLT